MPAPLTTALLVVAAITTSISAIGAVIIAVVALVHELAMSFLEG